MTEHEMTAEIQRLTLENAKLKAKKDQKSINGLTFRVSQKGAVSVYGLGRWPMTLYDEQWTKLLAEAPALVDYLTAERTKGTLSHKPAAE